MKSQVMFYGNLAKARMVLACVQASIVDCRRSRNIGAAREVLERYAQELEEIETDLVALINGAGTGEHFVNTGPGPWDDEPSSGRDVL